MSDFFVTVKPAGVVFATPDGSVVVKNKKEYERFIEDWQERCSGFLCSSLLDWPEDVTTDLDIIEVADLIRGNNVSGRNPKYNTK